MKHVVLHIRAPKGQFVTIDARGAVSYRQDGEGRRIPLGKIKRKAHMFYYVKNGAVYEADREGMLGKRTAKKPAKKKPAKKTAKRPAKKSAKKKPAKKSAKKKPAKKSAKKGRVFGYAKGAVKKSPLLTEVRDELIHLGYSKARATATVKKFSDSIPEEYSVHGSSPYGIAYAIAKTYPAKKKTAKKGRAYGYAKSPAVVQLEGVSLSKCKNWKTSKMSDCGGRMFKRGRTTLCENCLNRSKKSASKRGSR